MTRESPGPCSLARQSATADDCDAQDSLRSAHMRSFIVLFGLMLTNTAVAAVCSRPTPPEIPAHKPSSQRIERKLSREVAEYVSASAKYVVCFRDNGADAAAVAEQEYLALHAVSDLINRYETRVGASDSLIAEMAKLAGNESSGLGCFIGRDTAQARQRCGADAQCRGRTRERREVRGGPSRGRRARLRAPDPI